MTKITTAQPNGVNNPPKVEGPVRCHKCQLMCRDAEHYLSHECKASPSFIPVH